jgi:hypothetical protein
MFSAWHCTLQRVINRTLLFGLDHHPAAAGTHRLVRAFALVPSILFEVWADWD